MYLLKNIFNTDESRFDGDVVNVSQFNPGELKLKLKVLDECLGSKLKVPQSEVAGHRSGRPTLDKENCTLLKEKKRRERVRSQWKWLAGKESDGSVMEPDSCSTPKKEGGAVGSIARIGGLTH